MSSLFLTVDARDSNKVALFSCGKSNLRSGGSTDVPLVDGIKSPDFSLYEESDSQPLLAAWPTVTFEVAYAENDRKLARDCGRYVACSSGKVQLAMGLNIEHYPIEPGNPRKLKRVTCTYWTLDDIKTFVTLKKSGSRLNHLTRCDSYSDHDEEEHVLPAATKFSCVSKVNEKFVKYIVSQQQRYVASPFLFPLVPPLDLCHL